MRKYLVDAENNKIALSPLSYKEFMILNIWAGASDTAYATWLNHNGFKEARDFNEEYLASTLLILEFDTDETILSLDFNPSGDGETWIPYNADTLSAKQKELGGTHHFWLDD